MQHLIRYLAIVWAFFFLSPHAIAQQYVYQTITLKNGLPSDFITSLLFDKQGILWVGTDKGISRQNGAQIATITTDNGLPNNLVTTMMQDQNGQIWAAFNEGGLARIGMKNDVLYLLETHNNGLTVNTLQQDKQGNFWILANLPGALKKTWFKTKTIKGPWQKICTHDNYAAAAIDSTGTVWYSPNNDIEWHTAVNKSMISGFEPTDGKILIQSHAGNITGIGTKNMVVHFSNKKTETYPLPGNLAISHQIRYRFYNGKHLLFRHNLGIFMQPENKNTAPSIIELPNKNMFIWDMAADTYGNLSNSLFGHGIMVYKASYLIQFPIGEKVRKVVIDGDMVWFNTNIALYEFEAEKATLKTVISDATLNFTFCATNQQGKPLIATYHNVFTTNPFLPTLRSQYQRDFSDQISYQNETYLSSLSGGVHKLKAKGLDSLWQVPQKLTTTVVEHLRVGNNNLYALTYNKGFMEINLANQSVKTYSVKQGLLSNTVYDVLPEKDTLWVGTKGGLTLVTNHKIVTFDNTKGFEGKRVVCIFKDSMDRRWILSDEFLHLFQDNRLYAIRSYPVLINDQSYITTAVFQPKKQRLWIGTSQNMLAIDIKNLIPGNDYFGIQLQSVFVGDSLYSQSNNQLVLKSQHPVIRFRFSGPHYSLYTRPAIWIRLKGLEDEWQRMEPLFTECKYNSLPEGNYSLEVKTEGPDFGKSQIYTLANIEVMPPWWKKGWFWTLIILTTALLVGLFSRYMVHRKYQTVLKQMEAEKIHQMQLARISRDLHDNVGSMLTIMINRLEDESMHPSKAGPKPIIQIARTALGQLRDTIWAIEKNNITVAQWISRTIEFVNHLNSNTRKVQFEFNWPEDHLLKPHEALHSFRIVQEACNNVVKHADATEMNVRGKMAGNKFLLEIWDNGKGIAEGTRPGFGLKNMHKRAREMDANFEIIAEPLGGTRLQLSWEAYKYNPKG